MPHPTRTPSAGAQADSTSLPGHREDMPALPAEVTLAVLPTYYGEGAPRILIGAATSGLPLIATDVPGCRQVVRHEDNGLLVPPRAPVALAGAIERLMVDPQERAKMGARSRAIACEEFSEERVLNETMKAYETALQGSGKPQTRALLMAAVVEAVGGALPLTKSGSGRRVLELARTCGLRTIGAQRHSQILRWACTKPRQATRNKTSSAPAAKRRRSPSLV